MLYNTRIFSAVFRSGRLPGLLNRCNSSGASLVVRPLVAPVQEKRNGYNVLNSRSLQTSVSKQSGMPQLDVPTYMHQYVSVCVALYILHYMIATRSLPNYLKNKKIREHAAANASAGAVEESATVKKSMDAMKKILEQ